MLVARGWTRSPLVVAAVCGLWLGKNIGQIFQDGGACLKRFIERVARIGDGSVIAVCLLHTGAHRGIIEERKKTKGAEFIYVAVKALTRGPTEDRLVAGGPLMVFLKLARKKTAYVVRDTQSRQSRTKAGAIQNTDQSGQNEARPTANNREELWSMQVMYIELAAPMKGGFTDKSPINRFMISRK